MIMQMLKLGLELVTDQIRRRIDNPRIFRIRKSELDRGLDKSWIKSTKAK